MVVRLDVGGYQSLAGQSKPTLTSERRFRFTGCPSARPIYPPGDKQATVLDMLTFEEETPQTHTDRTALEADLAEIADPGYAFNEEERTIGMRAVGAPIPSDTGAYWMQLASQGQRPV